MQTEAFLFGDEIAVEPVAPGVTRKLLGFNNQIMMVKVFFEEGSEGYVHSHFHSQVAYVERGEFDVTVAIITTRAALHSGRICEHCLVTWKPPARH